MLLCTVKFFHFCIHWRWHFCHLAQWIIHSRSAFNFQSACVRWRLKCLRVLKVCWVRWPFRWLNKRFSLILILTTCWRWNDLHCLFGIRSNYIYTFPDFPHSLACFTQEVLAFWISSKSRSIRTTRPLICHYVDYIVYSKWKVLQYAYV